VCRRLLERDELVTEHLATHTMPVSEGPRGYRMFKEKTDQNILGLPPGG
jgi:hypothetical protein